MKPPIEAVYWRDAHFSLDEDDLQGDDYICVTVGFASPDGRFLRVAGEKLPNGDGYRGVTRIPNEMVVRREVLTPERSGGQPVGTCRPNCIDECPGSSQCGKGLSSTDAKK